MRKFFLIPVLALFTCVSMWGATVPVSTYAELKSAVATANDGDVIELTADINYGKLGYANNLNITRSITLDGKGHTLTGAAQRESSQTAQYATVWVNIGGTDSVAVVFKDIKIINNNKGATGKDFVIHTRGKLKSITLENVELDATACAANATCLQIGGNHYNTINVAINDCKFVAGASSYAFSTWNTIKLETRNTKYSGYCAMYFHQNGSYTGTKETRVDADACDFDAPNVHSGETNAFGVFAAFSENIKLYLHNCGMNAQARGTALQAMLTSDSFSHNPGHYMEITGDNSHINGDFTLNFSPYGYDRIEIKGGTYSVDPSNYKVYANSNVFANFVPEGYEVKEITMEGVASHLYRVVKKAATKEVEDPEDPTQTIEVLYNLNDNVQGVDSGNNPNTSFELSAGTEMKLDSATVTAGYVQVKDNATEGATTVTVGTPSQDQTLIINNGLDVQGESQVIVQAGSTLEIGEGGINTQQPSNIVIGADENGAASLIMDPTITVNKTPNLTVKMKAKQIGWLNVAGDKYYFWHRFALPIQEAATWVKTPNKSTYVFGWNYSANDWEQLSALTQMIPFKGYTLSADYENLGDVEYTFTGQLAGNTNNLLQFERNGFNFFGNSYTGYIDILALVDQIMGDNKIDGTVWMWYQVNQSYVAVPLQALRENPSAFDSWQREVAPMQTFILKQNGATNATTELNYASAVWGNPRYGHSITSAPAPRREEASDNTNMRIVVTAENGKSDFVMFTENAQFTDAFEKGYDGEKYMNENALNMYATVEGADYTAVATDNLEGKTLSIKTVESVNYKMTFAKVNTEEYAIRDNVTGAIIAIEEGATYEFAAQPNSLVENRFKIVPVAKMPTAIENTEVKANAKGIYTIMGQYLGEDFDVLPAGIYVVNGVKIVK